MEPVTLSAGELVLDQPTLADVPLITEYCQDPVFEKFMALPWPYKREHAEFFVTTFVPRGWSRDEEVTWAIRDGEQFVGVVGVHAKESMLGYWLGAPHRGRGYMPRAVTAVVDWVFEQGLTDVVRWEAVEGNLASCAVARKTGFQYTGTRPALVLARDGSAPISWTAELWWDDDRSEKAGWPDEDAQGEL